MKTQIQIQYYNGVNRMPPMICSCYAGVPGTMYKTQTLGTKKIQMKKKYKYDTQSNVPRENVLCKN